MTTKMSSLSPANDRQSISSSPLSPSSPSITDSDSFRSSGSGSGGGNMLNQETRLNHNENIMENVVGGGGGGGNANKINGGKSPILIKYKYYDYNGFRQEQPNQDMNFNSNYNGNGNNETRAIQRQLSPTFKQNLDQIVRNSQQQQQNTKQQQQLTSPDTNNLNINSNINNNNNNTTSPLSPPSSPDDQQQQHLIQLARRYKLSSYEQRCLRCNKTVYQMDKVGPLKDFTFYHHDCFKCRVCGTKLTLKTYFNNQQASDDQEVYCHRHCPKTGPGKLDNQSVGIRAALNAPKVFDPSLSATNCCLINSPNLAGYNHHAAMGNGGDHQPNGTAYNSQLSNGRQLLLDTSHNHHQQQQAAPHVNSSAMYIQHAVQQTKLQNIYRQSQVDKKISQFINRRLEFLEPKQKMLEMRHREEEDALFKQFEAKWRQEENYISEQIKEEWQLELSKLLDKYTQQLSNIHQKHSSAAATDFRRSQAKLQQQQQLQQQVPSSKLPQEVSIDESKMIELERMNLEKTMTIKLDRKKETLKRKLKEFERQATAELVEKQSREMLTLISMKLEEYKEKQKRKIGSELEQFEAIESLANQLGSSLAVSGKQVTSQREYSAKLAGSINGQQGGGKVKPVGRSAFASSTATQTNNGIGGPNMEVPSPRPPKISKMELYNNEQPDEVFKEIDELAINVAKEDQRTFTDLVHHLTRNCLTDIEKVRAIFRWITVKNLNTMQFDSSVKPDTPLGLLRGIKNGSESYHVLFKRLCSYAGLHCVVIKGYSKSAGYQPGVRFEGNRFRNSWNAVYVAGAWRFVQCNWGARHLVSVAVMQDKNRGSNISSDSPVGPEGNVMLRHQAEYRHHSETGLQANQQPVKLHHSHSGIHSHPSHPLLHHPHSHHHHQQHHHHQLAPLNHGRRGLANTGIMPPPVGAGGVGPMDATSCQLQPQIITATTTIGSPNSNSSSSYSSGCSSRHSSPPVEVSAKQLTATSGGGCLAVPQAKSVKSPVAAAATDSLRYEYDDHYFLTDPDEFIYEFYPLAPEWQLIKTRPISLSEFEQLPFVRSLFFKYGLYFPQNNIRSVLYTDSSGATTIRIGMPTHMIPSLIFHYNLKYYHSDSEHHDGISLKRFVMQSIESGDGPNGQVLLSNIVSFRVHLPENGSYILDIFANSTTPTQYITGEPMKFKSVCKFKIIAKNLRTVMIPLPGCASGEYGPMKATRLFGIIPISHEGGLITVQNEKRYLEIQLRMTRPLLDFMASLHKNGYDERQLSKSIKIFIDGDIVYIRVKFFEDGQYGLDIYTRDQQQQISANYQATGDQQLAQQQQVASKQPKQLLTHCCKYLINVKGQAQQAVMAVGEQQ